MKRRRYILARVIGLILIALATSVFILQIPSVQTQLARQLTSLAGKSLNGRISFGSLSIVPGNGLLITDIVIIDDEPYADVDTVFSASSIKAGFSLRSLLKGMPIRIRSVQIDDGHFTLTSEPGGEYSGNIQRVFKLKPSGKQPGPGSIFHIRKAEINRFRFQLKNYRPDDKPDPEIGFDWSDLDLTANIDASDLHFTDGRMYGTCNHLDAVAKGGYGIRELKALAAVGRGQALISGLSLYDNAGTGLEMEELSLNFEDSKAFSNFVEEVRLEGTFSPSVFSFGTLQYFSGKKSGNHSSFEIFQGSFSGPVCDLQVKGLDFIEQVSNVSASVRRLQLNGLPDIGDCWAEGIIENLSFNSKGLSSIIREFSGKNVKIPEGLNARLSLKGIGPTNHFHALLEGDTGVGTLNSELDLDNLTDPGRDLVVRGRIGADNLTPGSFVRIEGLGEADLNARLTARLGKDPGVDIDSLGISRLDYSGYTYSGISLKGRYSRNDTDLLLKSSDPNLKMSVTATEKGEGYLIDAKVASAVLTNLGFEEKTGLSNFSGAVTARLSSIRKDDLKANVSLANLEFAKSDGRTRSLKALDADIAKNAGGLHLALDSKPVNGSIFFNNIEDFSVNIGLNDRERLLDFFVPGLYVSRGSRISAMRKPDGSVRLEADSPFVLIGKNTVRNATVRLNTLGEKIDFRAGCNSARLGEDEIEKPGIRIFGDCIIGEKDFILNTVSDSSYLQFSNEIWRMNSSHISLDSLRLDIGNFRINGPSEQLIAVDGAISKKDADTLKLKLGNIRLSILDSLLQANTGIKGTVNADARMISPSSKGKRIYASVDCDDLKVSDMEAGEISINASLNGPQVEASLLNTLEGRQLLSLNASVDTGEKKLDATGEIDGFNLGVAQPLLKNLFSEMGGRVFGHFKAEGKFDKLNVRSDSISLDNALLRLRFTNVPYTVNGKMVLTTDGLNADRLRISDDEGGSGRLRANLLFNSFKKPEIKAGMAFHDLKILGKESDLEGSFYGNAYASGDVNVSGPLKSMLISVNASTAKEGQIHVPVGSALAGESKILSFRTIHDLRKNHRKNGTEIAAEEEDESAARKSDIKIKASVSVRDNTKAMVEIDKSQGHAISVQGNGNVTLDIRPSSGVLDIGGLYNITKGKYHFSALSNIAVKDFTIQPGSSIRFNGKPKDSEFDITALYTRKASIAPLLKDTTSVAGMRTVECGLRIANKISNPDLKFSINIPDLDPSTKSQVDGALNTEDKIQKQFVAFVLTGSFIPSEDSGITFNGGNAVFSNLSSMMSGQLNSILQNLNIPLDMGLNYQQTSSGKDMFDVAVSTQLFNNRVLVNGSVGSRKKGTSSSTDVVGDVDIEVKLNKSGQLRLKLFSHSADGYTNYLDNSQRNGVGLSYQREYSDFVRFIKSIFRKKRPNDAGNSEFIHRKRRTKTIKIDE